MQHVVAMFGSTVLAPLLMGFDPNLCIFMSGIGTRCSSLAAACRATRLELRVHRLVIAVTGYGGSGPNPNRRARRDHRVRCRVRRDRRAGAGDRHALDRDADAAGRDRRVVNSTLRRSRSRACPGRPSNR
ncbi:putative uracil permease [Burkholderia cepacia]|nr:putative uracil permease [Burkholderia cepacia]